MAFGLLNFSKKICGVEKLCFMGFGRAASMRFLGLEAWVREREEKALAEPQEFDQMCTKRCCFL